MYSTPILIIYFNRPNELKQNLISLSTFKPANLYLACDGPRDTVSTDAQKIEECRTIIKEIIDWECHISEYNSDSNLGCDTWVPKAISWFFSKVEMGIILEDDCIIDSNFARFTAEMLELYKDDQRIMNISAANFQEKRWGDGDYYFSVYPYIWGWATWARAWKQYEQNFDRVSAFIIEKNGISNIFEDPTQRKYWLKFFHRIYSGKSDHWDAKWAFSVWASGGLSITPNINLVKNIGFGIDATHTKNEFDKVEMTIHELPKIIKHPSTGLVSNEKADNYLFKHRYKPKKIKLLLNIMLSSLKLSR